MLLQAYDLKTESFVFCDKRFTISTNDIYYILGLREEGFLPLLGQEAYHLVFADNYLGFEKIKEE